MYDFAVLTHL